MEVSGGVGGEARCIVAYSRGGSEGTAADEPTAVNKQQHLSLSLQQSLTVEKEAERTALLHMAKRE